MDVSVRRLGTTFPQRRPDVRVPGLELGLEVGIHCVDVELLEMMHGVLG